MTIATSTGKWNYLVGTTGIWDKQPETEDIDVTGKSVAIELNGHTYTGKITGALIYNNGKLINQDENEGETSESET